jgi:hypothetical protein
MDEDEPDAQDSESAFFYRFDLNNTPLLFSSSPLDTIGSPLKTILSWMYPTFSLRMTLLALLVGIN